MLIVFAGLPGVGKSTLARALAHEMRAFWLRIDTIEQAIVASALGVPSAVDAGYRAAYGAAADNLALGHRVIADSVNPIALTRRAWRGVAEAAGVPLVEVEVICSDPAEHRRRVEGRGVDIPGLRPPTWAQVTARDYEAWDSPPTLVVDTAGRSVAACLGEVTGVVSLCLSTTLAATGAR